MMNPIHSVHVPLSQRPGGEPRLASACRRLLRTFLLPLSLLGCGDPVADVRLSISMAVESVSPPAVGTRGGEAVILTGRNLLGVTSVRVGDNAAPIIAQENSRLTFVAPPNRPGNRTLVLLSPAGETTASIGLSYKVERPSFAVQHVLAPNLIFTAPNETSPVREFTVGDFDGDGKPDLVVLRTGALEWHGSADGQIHRQTFADDPLARRRIVGAADLDGDKRADLVTWLSPGEWSVWWSDPAGGPLRLESQGTLGPVPNTPDAFSETLLGNFTPGGGIELAVLSAGMEIFRLRPGAAPEKVGARPDIKFDSSKRGTRQQAEPLVPCESCLPREAMPPVAADLDADGFTDIVYFGADHLIHATRAPAFSPADEWVGFAGHDVEANFRFAVGDITGDDRPDIVLHDALVAGRGDGTFGPVQTHEPLCGWGSFIGNETLYAGPLVSGDPSVGLTVSPCYGGLVVHRWNRGRVEKQEFPFVTIFHSMPTHHFVDLDGDRLIDFVHLSSVGVVIDHGVDQNTPFGPHGALPQAGEHVRLRGTGTQPLMATGNFGPDRSLAILRARTVSLLERTGSNLRMVASVELPKAADALAACDLDGNGTDDLLVKTNNASSLVAIEVGPQGLGPARQVAAGLLNEMVTDLVVGDLNRDGRCDAVVSRGLVLPGEWLAHRLPAEARPRSAGTVPLVVAPIDPGSFLFVQSEWPQGLKGVDLEGDGDLDLYHRTGRGLLRNQGEGRFVEEPLPIRYRGASLEALEVIDLLLERTGAKLTAQVLALPPDAALGGGCGTPRLQCGHLLVGTATQDAGGAWSELRATFAVVNGAPTDLVPGDVDGDGLRDVIVTVDPDSDPFKRPSDFNFLVFQRTADGGLAVPRPLSVPSPLGTNTGALLTSARLFDADADGLDDLIFGVWASDDMWVARNDSE